MKKTKTKFRYRIPKYGDGGQATAVDDTSQVKSPVIGAAGSFLPMAGQLGAGLLDNTAQLKTTDAAGLDPSRGLQDKNQTAGKTAGAAVGAALNLVPGVGPLLSSALTPVLSSAGAAIQRSIQQRKVDEQAVNDKLNQKAVAGTDVKMKKGGKINIKPENKGKFTATMKKTGKSAEELSHSKNPLTRKRAVFAMNARKWNHSGRAKMETGGMMNAGMKSTPTYKIISDLNLPPHPKQGINPAGNIDVPLKNGKVARINAEGGELLVEDMMKNRYIIPKDKAAAFQSAVSAGNHMAAKKIVDSLPKKTQNGKAAGGLTFDQYYKAKQGGWDSYDQATQYYQEYLNDINNKTPYSSPANTFSQVGGNWITLANSGSAGYSAPATLPNAPMTQARKPLINTNDIRESLNASAMKNPGAGKQAVGDIVEGAAMYAPAIYNLTTGIFGKPITEKPVYNPYEGESLGILRNMKYTPDYRNIRLSEAAGRKFIANRANGTGSALSNMQNLGYNTERAVAEADRSAQGINNQYKAGYAEALGNYGQQRVNADLYANQLTRQNKANKYNYLSQGLSDVSAITQNNRNRRVYDKMYRDVFGVPMPK